ncbi:Protein saf4 [Ophidiomyces ophidiicola]|nr:Protein saf4 [Ophidiomyces ophidiicola]KAI1928207.1 Protein saf4 [Ophidiomyces ophidiicola]KAI1973174.1 Protein saf4 [Ophidiomyces ophidiicola]KAI2008587.1 Protein saf4 [Ophidiomyces ophidiicola]KAI2027347.1 Protein saf4 [Ophidiomyces ophidiicola]
MQGFNMGRYVPPDQEGLATGNKLAGKHALGSRARHLHTTGALVVRFEMPFAIWCSTCQPADSVLIGQGVRFNAEKKKIGNYYSTPIYSFRMKHGPCGGWIEIRTDPKNTEYVVTEGARRKATSEFTKGEYEEGGIGEIRIKLPGEEEAVEDPFAKFESKVADKNKYATAQTRIEELLVRQARDWEDPYEKSRNLRRSFREGRKGRERALEKAETLRDKMSLGIDLVEEIDDDGIRAGMIDFGSPSSTPAEGLSTQSRARPLFSTVEEHNTNNLKWSLGKVSRKPAAEVATKKIVLLKEELKGNTKAAMDPFPEDIDEDWKPGAKRQKRSANNGAAIRGNTEEESTVMNQTDNKLNGVSRDRRTARASSLEATKASVLSNMVTLVDYDSDTD